MKTLVALVIGLVALASTQAIAAPPTVQADYEANTRVSSPTAVSVEALGRGMAWSLQLDQALDEDMVAGLGYGRTGLKNASGADADSAELLPIYVNYYLARKHRAFFATAGATIVLNSSDVAGLRSKTGNLEYTSSIAVPTVGLGFENRSDANFLFRATVYGMFAKEVKPWFGLTLGYAF